MLAVESLQFTYPTAESPAVRDVSFEVREGEIFGFLGPSGAGKSTVQKILVALLPLQDGDVKYGGCSLRSLGREFFAQVGVSFEHPNLFPRLTGLENLTAFEGLYGGLKIDPLAMLERLGMGDAANKRAGDYSKGMKQRLVFARALLHQPRYLFLDEPTSGLDPATARVVMSIVAEERARGCHVLLTTHDMLVADTLCDRIAFLQAGQIAALDTPRELKLKYGQRSIKVEHRDGGVLRTANLFVDDSADREALQALVAAGQVETLHSQEATLDQVFVKITGQELLQ